jgi:hypothetical protein
MLKYTDIFLLIVGLYIVDTSQMRSREAPPTCYLGRVRVT